MRRSALRYLVGTEICGEKVGGRMCLLPPGHERSDLIHSTRWPLGKLTVEQKLRRENAKLKAQRDRRQRHREHLIRQLRSIQQARARDRAYLGFRVEYRIRGGANRVRRYYRFVIHRTVQRRSWKQRA